MNVADRNFEIVLRFSDRVEALQTFANDVQDGWQRGDSLTIERFRERFSAGFVNTGVLDAYDEKINISIELTLPYEALYRDRGNSVYLVKGPRYSLREAVANGDILKQELKFYDD